MMDLSFNPFLQALGWTLLHSIWQGLLVAIVIGVLLRQLKGYEANLRYFVSLLGMAVIVFWATLTFETYYFNSADPVLITGESVGLSLEGAAEAVPEFSWDAGLLQVSSSVEIILPWFMIFWIGGLILFTLKNIFNLLEVRKLRNSGKSRMDQTIENRLKILAKKLRLGLKVEIFESELVRTPIVLGVFKPMILFPVGLVNGLSERQVEAILLHELAHIKRQDYLINLIQTIIETIFFFNPAIWFLSSKIREERENCCDDIAIEFESDPMEYARALTLIGSWQSVNLAMGAAGSSNKLYARIKRMFNPAKRTTMKDKLITMIILGIALASLTVYTLSSYTSFREGMYSNAEHQIDPQLLTADASGAIMTPSVVTLLEQVKTHPLVDDDDEDKKKKKKKASKAQLQEELKEKEARIRELEKELEDKERTRVYRYRSDELDRAREERDRAREDRERLRDDRDELRDNARQDREEAREHRDAVRKERDKYRQYEMHLHGNSKDRDKAMKELEKEMRELNKHLEEEGFSGSYRYNFSYDFDEDILDDVMDILDEVTEQLDHIPDVSIHVDEDQMERDLEKFEREIEIHESEIEDAIHRATRIIELKAREIEDAASRIEVSLGEWEENFKEFEKMMKEELVRDGVIKNVNQDIDFHIRKDKVSVDGEELSPELQEKYLKLWNEFYDSNEIKVDFRFNDEDRE